MISSVLVIPWKTIDLEIKARNLNQNDVAQRLWITEKHLISLIKWEVFITPEMALKLEYVFWISAGSRLSFDKIYQEQKARLEERKQLEEEENIISNYVVSKNKKTLINKWFIQPTKDKLWLVKQIKQFFSVSNVKAIDWIYNDYIPENLTACYRKNNKFELKKESLYTFFRIWELDADKQQVEEFEKTNKNELLNCLKKQLSEEVPNIHEIQKILNEYGIYFSFLNEDLEKLPIKWFVRYYWDNPLIQLTNKWKMTDIFWFNLFHELWHIYSHLKKKTNLIDVDWFEWTQENIEQEADSFADKNIIDKKQYNLLKENYSPRLLRKIWQENGVHIWILAGMLAHDKVISWKTASRWRTVME